MGKLTIGVNNSKNSTVEIKFHKLELIDVQQNQHHNDYSHYRFIRLILSISIFHSSTSPLHSSIAVEDTRFW